MFGSRLFKNPQRYSYNMYHKIIIDAESFIIQRKKEKMHKIYS